MCKNINSRSTKIKQKCNISQIKHKRKSMKEKKE